MIYVYKEVVSTFSGSQGMIELLWNFLFIDRYAGKLMSSGALVLLTLKYSKESTDAAIIVNCEKISICSLLAKEVSNILSRA